MNREETAKILTEASLVDNRRITEAHVEQWWRTLADLSFEECQRAVVEHYKQTNDWLQPSHLRKLVKKHREELAEQRHSRQLEAAYSPDPDKQYPGKPKNFDEMVDFYTQLQKNHPRPAGMDPDEHARSLGFTVPKAVW